MWWQLFMVLVATSVVSADDSEEGPNCISVLHAECEDEYDKKPDFPGNEEDLEEFCEYALNYIDCSDRVFSSCDGEDSSFGRYMKEMGALARRVCIEDPLLRTAIATILPCFKENLDEVKSCDAGFIEDEDAFTDAVNEIISVGTSEDSRSRRCLHLLYGVGCTAATTGLNCGDVAKDVVLNLLQTLETPFEACPAGVKEKLHQKRMMMCTVALMNHECEPNDGKIPDFPGNIEELEEFCKFALKYFECADRVFSNCPEDQSAFIRFEKETAANVRRICSEDLLRTAVVSILPCFKENMVAIGRCEESISFDRESFAEAMIELQITDSDELDDSRVRCLNVLYAYGCIAATTGLLCGDVARDVIVNILQGFEQPLEFCPAGIKEKIPEIAEVMQIEAEKVNSVEDKLKKKK